VEPWAFESAPGPEQAYLEAQEKLAAHALAGGDPGTAERHLRAAVGVDPLRESAQRALMQALAAGGNYAAALLVYRELRLLLQRELNAQPDGRPRRSSSGCGGGATPAPSRRPASVSFPATGNRRSCTSPPTAGEDDDLPLHRHRGEHTRRWETHPEGMRHALARHDRLLRQAIEGHAGIVFKTVGDQFCVAFSKAPDALAAALAAQRTLQGEPWARCHRWRCGWRCTPARWRRREGDYFGLPLIELLGCWMPPTEGKSFSPWPPWSWCATTCPTAPVSGPGRTSPPRSHPPRAPLPGAGPRPADRLSRRSAPSTPMTITCPPN